MKRPHLLSLILLVLSGAAGGAAPGPSTAAPSSPAELEKKVDAYLSPYVRLHAFSGVVLLAKGDAVLLEKAYGMANAEFGVPNRPDTRFAIASISKRFTGIVVARLAGEKKITETDKLSKWVPDFPSADKITVAHLLNHYSGVRDPASLRGTIRVSRTPRETVEILKKEPLGSEPGAVYSYTTANYAILAHVIERVTGRPYAEVVGDFVYKPAGMTDSGELATTGVVPRLATGYMPDPFSDGLSVCGPEDTSWKLGGGASYSTARDLHRFARALYGGKLLGKVRPVEAFKHSPLFDRSSLSSSGAFPGAGANLLTFPDDEVTVVVLSNNYSTVPSTITRDLAAMYFGEKFESPQVELARDAAPMDPHFAGSYEVVGRPWNFEIGFRDGKPVLTNNTIRRSALFRIDADTWFGPLDWAKVKLRFSPEGAFEGSFTLPGSEPLTLKRLSAGGAR
jgi:CubicO group peptidase (beta-lactamase class C family)